MKNKLMRILCLALSMVMLLGVLAACNQDPVEPITQDPTTPADPAAPEDPGAPPEPEREPSGTLTVGYGAPATGDFIEGFGNFAYDMSIKILLHGYCQAFVIDDAGDLAINPTVLKDLQSELDSEGNKTYTFTLQEDLKWSDGSPITAKDYVGSVLWDASAEWVEAGAASIIGAELVGYEEYKGYYEPVEGGVEIDVEYDEDWEEPIGDIEIWYDENWEPLLDENGDFIPAIWVAGGGAFAGVQLLGEFEYSLTIRAEEIPNFGEWGLIAIDPKPMHTYAPGIDIVSDAGGASFASSILEDATRIAETERFAPTVVAGPYTFVSFTNNVVTLEVNRNFKGDHEGRKPMIEFIQQIETSDETDVDQLFAGEVDYLPENIIGDKIERTKAEDGFYVHSFLRNGYGVLNYMADWGPTADVNVRWAIACLVDRHALLDQVLGGYGGLVDTEAGEAQWMYQMKRAELQETLIPIALSIDRANGYLDQTEWKYEADGVTPFDASKANAEGTYMRHNENGDMLTVFHAAANAEIGSILEIEFLRNTPLAGMQYNFENVEWVAFQAHFYDAASLPDEERVYSTFSMGTGFGVPFDPYFNWHTDWLGTWNNPTSFSDPELDRLMVQLRRTEPGDNATYLERWFEYAVRWNEMLPALPLYSNEYFDLLSERVQGVNSTPFASWHQVICEMYIVE